MYEKRQGTDCFHRTITKSYNNAINTKSLKTTETQNKHLKIMEAIWQFVNMLKNIFERNKHKKTWHISSLGSVEKTNRFS